MNRRQKIIVSVVGIFIALLALVGITYGYFLTRIQGNTNTTSISVTTADLKLVYGDGNQKVITGTNILPGTLIGEKDFTVSNQGNDTEYVVIIDGDNKLDNGINPITVTYASDGTNVENVPYNEGDITSFESNDFVYTLSCTSNIDGKTCNEKTLESTFPMNGAVIVGNAIEENEVHTYSLKVTYKNTDEDQSLDMNKKFNAIVNIMDIRSINPYKTDNDEVNKTSLTYNIINNSLLKKNGTELKSVPYTIPLEEKSGKFEGTGTYKKEYIEGIVAVGSTAEGAYNCAYDLICENGAEYNSSLTCEEVNKKYVSTSNYETYYIEGCDGEKPYTLIEVESVLSTEEDDYGTSYYYRGMVEDNYVNFAEMCFRIVRIDGNGNVRVILDDQYAECDDTSTVDDENIYTGNWQIPTSDGNTDGWFGLDFGVNGAKDYINSTNGMVNSLKNFESKLKTKIGDLYLEKNISDLLSYGNWCFNDLIYDDKEDKIELNNYSNGAYTYIPYDTSLRLGIINSADINGATINYNVNKEATLKCRGTNMFYWDELNQNPMYVGALTADEAIFAGGMSGDYWADNLDYYLKSNIGYSTLTPAYFDSMTYNAFIVNEYGGVYFSTISSEKVRPMITLNKNTVIELGGDGTITNPYVIK